MNNTEFNTTKTPLLGMASQISDGSRAWATITHYVRVALDCRIYR